MITEETKKNHRGIWFVYAGTELIRRTAQMRGTWPYEVKCSCGNFETRTGGGTAGYCKQQLEDHRYDVQTGTS